MCGISGIIYNKIPKQTKKFKACSDLQSYRGPDFTGYFGDEYSDFVHYRLSILDLDSRANQPFTDEKKKKFLIYNGEIYNYKDLIKSYHQQVNTSSDTEVLFRLMSSANFNYTELNGIYAFAFYDSHEKSLTIVRDKLGVKPLYYYHGEDFFMFASEAKVIYNYIDKLKIDYQVLSEYLMYGHSNGLNTMVCGVKKLAPGTSMCLNIDTFKTKYSTFWSQEEEVKHQIKPSYENAKKEARLRLEKAVERQCVSDVQVGAYLSGGIDSSALVAMASKYTNRKLKTYSVDFDKNAHSELKAAAKVAKKYNTEHHEFQVNLKNVEDYLADLIFQYDEPFADPAMIPLHLMAQEARLSSTVILQGDGGDEIFAGYGRHLDALQFKKRKLLFKGLKHLHTNTSKREYFKFRYDSLNFRNRAEYFAHSVPFDDKNDFIKYSQNSKAQLLKETQPTLNYYKIQSSYKSYSLMQAMLYTDMENILQHKYLEKVDKVNMWQSIEARVPFLDDELVSYVMCLPGKYKIKKGITKYFLRDVLKDYLPLDILYGRKRSFGTPIVNWLRTSLYDYTLQVFEEAKKYNYPVDYNQLINALQNLKKGKSPHTGEVLWKYLVLTLWFNKYKNKLVF